jgi:hypothetical protein
MVRLPFTKSKEEKEQERKIRLRQTQTKVTRYIREAQQLRTQYEKNAIEALRIKNTTLKVRFAAKMHILDNRIQAMESYRLILNDFELTRQQGGVLSDMAVTIKDFAQVLRGESLSTKEAAQISSTLDQIFSYTQQADFTLNSVIDNMNDKMLDVGIVDDAEVEKILNSIDQKAGVSPPSPLSTVPYSPRRIQTTDQIQRDHNNQQPEIKPIRSSNPANPYNELDQRIEKGLQEIQKNKRNQG